MKKHIKKLGMALILLGIAILAANTAWGHGDANWLLFLSLGIIVAGVVVHVTGIKRESKY